MTPIILLLVTILLFFLALKTTNKLWFAVLWLLFGLFFITTYYIRFDSSGSNATNNYNILRIDTMTLILSYLYFLVLYFSAVWIMIFNKKRQLLYLPLVVFAIIHFWNFFIMDGIEHFKLVFIEVFIPSALSFFPLYYVLYRKFIRKNESQ